MAVTGYDIILKKIERRNDIEDSECVLSNLACYSLREQEASCADVFTDTSCEYPLIAYHNWKDPRCATSFVGLSPRFAILKGFYFQHHHVSPGSRLQNDFCAKGNSN